MPPAARISDPHTCPKVEPGPVPHVGGPVVSGAGSVFIGHMPAARISDTMVCIGPPDSVSAGEGTVIICGQPAARLGDSSSHGGVIAAGCPTVIIGSSAQAQPITLAAQDSQPFCEECERNKAAARTRAEEPAQAETSSEHQEIFRQIQKRLDRVAPVVDRWLSRNSLRWAVVYRKVRKDRPEFAALIRGRVLDRVMNAWLEKRFSDVPGMRADRCVQGMESRLRPDLYLPKVQGERMLLEMGGRTKNVTKYGGFADRIYILYTPPAR